MIMTGCITLHLRVYSINHHTLSVGIKNRRNFKVVSKVIVRQEIQHDDYVKTLQTKEAVNKPAVFHAVS